MVPATAISFSELNSVCERSAGGRIFAWLDLDLVGDALRRSASSIFVFTSVGVTFGLTSYEKS
jgi:hypothetical protein